MSKLKNPVGWFEIPVTNMNRAVKFYSQVLDFDLTDRIHQMGPIEMCWLPFDHEGHGASGALVMHEMYEPDNKKGVVIYLSCEDVADSLKLVEGAGGKTIVEKTLIADDVGYMGLFIDSEGNRIAFHSKN